MTTLPKTGKRSYEKGVTPCTKCDRPTRSSRHTVADFPGTLRRSGRGMCGSCYNETVRAERRETATGPEYEITPCATCGHLTRDSRELIEDAPNTRVRIGLQCRPCSVNGAYVPPEQVATVAAGLEAFIARRRDRLERQARAERLRAAHRATYGLAS